MNNIFIIEKEEFWKQFDEKMLQLLEKKEGIYPKWMRSADVRDLLNISDSTLQTMRISGAIPAYKLGNTWFYRYDEIMETLQNGKIKAGGNE